MDEIVDLAEAHGIYLIEDAAEALGSKFRGIRAGKFGVGGVHSFSPDQNSCYWRRRLRFN